MFRRSKTENPFHVPVGIRAFSQVIWHLRGAFLGLEKLESVLWGRRLASVEIDRPIYISGLARSGSTILLEFLASLPQTACHRYLDYPAIYTPLLWNGLIDHLPVRRGSLHERPHKDGIMVNLDSPESMEEIIWNTFFPGVHDPSQRNALDASVSHPAFERFYARHLKKILLVRGGHRYVSKANYNAARLPYLLKLFPEARFVIPVRGVHRQVASYLKLNSYVSSVQRQFPSVLAHFRRACHFEFGLDMRPINTAGPGSVDDILELFRSGQDVRAWARYWSRIYRFLHEFVSSDARLAKACLLVPFEDLCDQPRPTLTRIVDHCQLEAPQHQLQEFSARLRAPTYYQTNLTPQQDAIVQEEAGETMRLLGYDESKRTWVGSA